MKRQIPNMLTASRFFIAIGFFILLGLYDPTRHGAWLIDVATAMFLVAVITDAIDGTIARKMGYVTNFGRVADPFVDKITICGAMIFFIGRPFADISGWAPWMLVVIIAREFLVTGMRGLSESVGSAFSATWAGKLKMFIQCIAIVWTLVYIGHWTEPRVEGWRLVGRDIAIWGTVFFTAASGLIYCKRAYHLFRMPPAAQPPQ